ncbi:MAG TPA: hypothetical protein VLK78_08470 [Candidatus Angelobacter sp.]|nr:hypothetical protein [Candidatus Angelobacter sp.]
MLTWLKQVFHPVEKKGQKENVPFQLPRIYSAEKRYVIESLRLKGYLLLEDFELEENLIADIFLKKERMAIIFLTDSTDPLERIHFVKIKAAVHAQGFLCFCFDRAHFYKSLSRLRFRLRQFDGDQRAT